MFIDCRNAIRNLTLSKSVVILAWSLCFFFFRQCISYSVALRIQNGFTWMYKHLALCIRIRTMTFSTRRTAQISNTCDIIFLFSRQYVCVLFGWYSHRIWIWIKWNAFNDRNRTNPKKKHILHNECDYNKRPKISYESFLEYNFFFVLMFLWICVSVHLWLGFV